MSEIKAGDKIKIITSVHLDRVGKTYKVLDIDFNGIVTYETPNIGRGSGTIYQCRVKKVNSIMRNT